MKRPGQLERKPMERSGPTVASRSGFSDDVKAIVRRRSANRCEAHTFACSGGAHHFHHILMRSQGGKGTADNALHVCHQCHTYIHAHPGESYLRGWLARSGVAP